jgi:hypothetical protein
MSRNEIKLTMTRMDSTRIGKNFGYMARTLKTMDVDQYETAAASVLEHHFDNHTCLMWREWCKRKLETEEQRKTSTKYYRCKKVDAKLYGLLQETISWFVYKDRLIEMAHDLDTNMNEAFNQICTWFALKNKVFAGSYSLHNRIAFAVGINSLGTLEFFKRIFWKLGITMTDNVLHYLSVKENFHIKKLTKVKTSQAKKDKNKRKYEKLKEDTAKAKIEFHKRQGTYRRGMNLDDPLEGLPPEQPAGKKLKTFCEYCGKSGHVTMKSKKCSAIQGSTKKYRKDDGTLLTEPANAPNNNNSAVQNDITDCDNFDLMPLEEVPGEDRGPYL